MTWLSSNWGVIGSLTLSHLWIALPAIALSVLFYVPIARWAAFSRRGGWVLSALSALYAVPSLPLLIVIPVIVGVTLRSPANMVIVLTLYGVAVLVRQVAEGFRAIPRATLQAANACGYSLPRRFVQVELPLATPVIVAGTRVVATSTVSLVTGCARWARCSLTVFSADSSPRSRPAWSRRSSLRSSSTRWCRASAGR